MSNNFTFIKMFSIVVIVIIMGGLDLIASSPATPTWMQCTSVQHDENTSTYTVNIQWRTGIINEDNPMPDSYEIYRLTVGHSEDKTILLANIEHDDSNPIQKFSDNTIEFEATYFYYVYAVANGRKSLNPGKTMAAVPGAYCVRMDAEIIDFISNPITVASPGRTYVYRAFAKHRSMRVQGLVRYHLKEGPEGMKIDLETGELTWDVPYDKSGDYFVQIEATSEEDSRALSRQEWYISVVSQQEMQLISKVEVPAVTELNLFPLPATDKITLDFMSEHSSNTFVLVDIKGNILFSKEIIGNIGFNTVNLNLNNLSNGNYFLRIINSKGETNTKLSVSR